MHRDWDKVVHYDNFTLIGYVPLNLRSSESIFGKLGPVGYLIGEGGQGFVVKGSATTGGAELAVKSIEGGKESLRTEEAENAMHLAARKEYNTVI